MLSATVRGCMSMFDDDDGVVVVVSALVRFFVKYVVCMCVCFLSRH